MLTERPLPFEASPGLASTPKETQLAYLLRVIREVALDRMEVYRVERLADGAVHLIVVKKP